MSKSLLFIPDISGYTKFIQTTEVEHSQHVISELLEVLVNANTQGLQLAEVEGDALFFYKENEIPSQENLLVQIESMFTAFYSHLKMLEKNRICPCNACATAPNLKLKIIAHSGNLQHIEVQGNRKPFGQQVIEAHRLLKNSVDSDNYVLISRSLALDVQLSPSYSSKLYRFRQGTDTYDGTEIDYLYSIIDTEDLKLRNFEAPNKVYMEKPPHIQLTKHYPVSAEALMEYITNYAYRTHWTDGIDTLEFAENEVTRIGSEHCCVINGKRLNFTTVTKDVQEGSLVYGELSTDPPVADEFYQFYTFTPITDQSCTLETEIYLEAKSPLKKLVIALVLKKIFKKNVEKALDGLLEFVQRMDKENNQSLSK